MARLVDWDDVRRTFEGGSLLIGNGLSRSIWSEFEYPSLFDIAMRFGLDADDVALFEKLNTRDFESVLQALWTAKAVADALGQEGSELDERYESIRSSLIRAVQQVHVPWELLDGSGALRLLHDAMLRYRTVYSTNYDLIPYWALMQDPDPFKDLFWGEDNSFDVTNTSVDEDKTRLLFVHGALHLYETAWSVSAKLVAAGSRLLERFGTDPEKVPLFVSEGTAKDKRRAIASSSYLNFVFQELLRERGSIVVFGQSLSDQDEHIAAALDRLGARLALAVRANRSSVVLRRRIAEYERRLVRSEVTFFDAATHPLSQVGEAANRFRS